MAAVDGPGGLGLGLGLGLALLAEGDQLRRAVLSGPPDCLLDPGPYSYDRPKSEV